ncbi:MAG: hypothetical protein WAP20_10800 [Limnochordia bacterium]
MSALCFSGLTAAQNIPRPYISPLPSRSDYYYVEYHPVEEQLSATEFSWDYDQEEIVFYLWGNHWILAVDEPSLDGFREYLAELGANIIVDDGDFLIANVDGPGGVWWACAQVFTDRYYEITVVQELEPPERPQEEELYAEEYADNVYDDGYYGEYDFYPPLINPLGDMAAYVSFDYAPGGYVDNWYYNADGEQFTFFGWGERWRLYVPVEGQEDPLAGLAAHIEALGGEIVENSRGLLVGELVDSAGYLWTGIGEYFGEDIYTDCG